ncbi:MAG: ATP-binding protein [Pseudomonadota bacterium]
MSTSRHRLSIGVSLMLSTGSVVIMMVLVSLVAWVLYDTLGKAIDQMTGSTMPAIVASRNLAMSSKGLSTIATEMILVDSVNDLTRKARYADILSEGLLAELESAGKINVNETTLLALKQIHRQLASSLDELESAVKKRLEITELKNLATRLFLEHNDSSSSILSSALKRVVPMEDLPLKISTENSMKAMNPVLWEFLALVQDMGKSVRQASGMTQVPDIDQKKEEASVIAQAFDTLEERLPENQLKSDLNGYLSNMRGLAFGERGVFHLQKQWTKNLALEKNLVTSCNLLSSQFELLTNNFVEASSSWANQLSQNTARQILKGKLVVLVLVSIGLLVSGLMIWVFGRSHLIVPLLSLVGTVRRVENGDMTTRAPEVGAAEIQDLARSFNRMTDQISLRKQELQQVHDLLDSVINSMASAIVAIDADGRVLLWNQEAMGLFGRDKAQVTGHPLEDCLFPLVLDPSLVRQAVQERSVQALKGIVMSRDDRSLLMDVTIFPLNYGQRPGAVLRIDDVTERMRIEEVMVQSEKMLSVGGLAAGMAHEINNPLAGILQNAQVIHNRISADLPVNYATAQAIGVPLELIVEYLRQREIHKLLASILDAGKRAARIVENMLSFSRKAGSRFTFHNMAELLDATVELYASDYDLKKKFDFRQIQIVREYVPDMPRVQCESSKIQQVFLNILKNGAEAIVEEKSFRMGADNGPGPAKEYRFVLRIRKDKDMACIEIEDNGPGMEEAVRKRIFEPFFTTKPVGIGTGLGMSVSYFIITENHGGTLEVESAPTQGSRFIIHIPFAVKNQLLAGQAS